MQLDELAGRSSISIAETRGAARVQHCMHTRCKQDATAVQWKHRIPTQPQYEHVVWEISTHASEV